MQNTTTNILLTKKCKLWYKKYIPVEIGVMYLFPLLLSPPQASTNLDIVSYVVFLEVVWVEDKVCLVLWNTVAMEGIAWGDHLPGHPPGGDSLVAWQEAGNVPNLTTATPWEWTQQGKPDWYLLECDVYM